jgi:hypothetical protein
MKAGDAIIYRGGGRGRPQHGRVVKVTPRKITVRVWAAAGWETRSVAKANVEPAVPPTGIEYVEFLEREVPPVATK